jgi:MFS transporter, FSR family, fosmidomycin resistance protein
MRRSAPFHVLFFASTAHGMNHVLIALYLTLVLVVAQDWHLPYNDLIALWAPGAMLIGLGAPFAGWLGDRFGETRMLIVCFFGLGISSVLAGLAQTPLQLEGALALLGLSGSIYHPVGFPWVVKHAAIRGRAVASTGIAGSFGVALSPIVAGGLATLAGWRIGFIVPGAITMALGLMLSWFYFTKRITDRKDDAVEHIAATRADKTRAFAVLAVTMTITLAIYSGFGTALPKLIQIGTAAGSYGFFAIGLVTGVISLLGAGAQFIGGHFADRGHAKRAYLAGFALLVLIFPLVIYSGGWSLVVAAVAVTFLFEWIAPIETLLLARYAPAAQRGLVFGIRYGLATIGTPAGVWLVAKLYDPAMFGFAYVLIVFTGLALAALAFAAFLPADQRKTAAAIGRGS